jgi:transposase-like protein
MRRTISAELKAKVAIESIKGLKTISEISSIYEVHPNQVSVWKKQYLDSAIETFSKPNLPEVKQKEQETDNLYRKIGQLEVENEFLKKSGVKFRASEPTFEDRACSCLTKFGAAMHPAWNKPQWALL